MTEELSNAAAPADEATTPARTLKRLGQARVNAFFQHLSRSGSVSLAAARVGLRRSTLYHLRNQHPGFARRWQDALDMGVDRLQDDAMRRAIEGVDKPVWRAGKQVGSVRQVDNRMVQFLLRAHRPEIYGERPPPSQRPRSTVTWQDFEAADRRLAAHRKERAAREAAEKAAEQTKNKKRK